MQSKKKLSKIIAVIVCCVLCFTFVGVTLADTTECEKNKETAHNIAESARSMGLPESDPIIIRAKEIWHENDNKISKAEEPITVETVETAETVEYVNPTDRDTIATAIYTEAWGGCSDRHRELVAAVIVNRVNSNKFPNTVTGVVTQRGQYPQGYANPNSTLGKRARQNPESWAKCQEIATKALLGKVDCPKNVVFQAEFTQGSGIYEIHRTSYSTTYFCYL